jgi:peptidoglycan-associated lipoprotein
MRPSTHSLALILAAFSWTACAHKEVKEGTSTPPATSSAAAPNQAATTPAASPQQTGAAPSTCTSDTQCANAQLCLNGRCTPITAGMGECAQVRVHFAFNEAVIRPEEVPAVQRMARCLKADRAMTLEIRGHADERGTDEYNLALGDQRARAVARYLENLGVGAKQLSTVSYGKERPLCSDHDEPCWQKNRRAGLVPK